MSGQAPTVGALSGAPPPLGGDQNRGPTVNAVTWSLTAVATFFVVVRMYGRYFITRNPGRDDLFAMLGLFLSITYSATLTAAVAAGNGRHPYYLTEAQLSKSIKLNTIAIVPGLMAFSVPKVSVACLLMRLLNPGKYQRWFLYTISIGIIPISMIDAIMLFVQCSPVRGLWDSNITPTCWSPFVLVDFAIFTGALSAFVDLYLALYAVHVLGRLNMTMGKKVGLCFVMGLGVLACIVTIVKTIFLPELADKSDYTYSTMDVLIWTSVEANIIIIAACLPTLRAPFLRLTGKNSSEYGHSQPSQQKVGYYMHPLSKKNHPQGNVDKSFPTDTVNSIKAESTEHMVSPNNILRTCDVRITYDEP
ncbi:hypothetical protein MMC08_009032 [Hypocenomyce scalaris]|nr:hypothetical protein [Hypocenomyce scalaris]